MMKRERQRVGIEEERCNFLMSRADFLLECISLKKKKCFRIHFAFLPRKILRLSSFLFAKEFIELGKNVKEYKN